MTEPDDSDLLAAEYVLGTLDTAEWGRAVLRIAADKAFADAVEDWQDRLSPLTEIVAAVPPPPHVFDDLIDRLFGRPERALEAGTLIQLKRRVVLWQAATAGCSALAAGLLAWIVIGSGTGSTAPDRFTAVLQRDAGAPSMVLNVDLVTRRFTVTPVAAQTPPGKSYQLWIIDPALGAPRSLGVLPSRAAPQQIVAGYDPAVITDATYAVTLEPQGGSPSGQPSGTPILSGRLVPTPP